MRPKTLTVVSHSRLQAAERIYRKGARKAYRRAWAVLQERLPELQEVAKAQSVDPAIIEALTSEIVSGLGDAAEEAAESIDADQMAAIMAQYRQMFASIGGFQRMADTVTQGVQAALEAWYADPSQDAADLSSSLQQWFAPWRADLVGITETTRLGAAATSEAANRLGAEQFEWATSEDDIVCSECIALDGETFAVGDMENTPPLHPGCRCSQALILPGDEEME